MISVEEARTRILAAIAPAGCETVSIADAWGRVLATEIRARNAHQPVPQPASARSARYRCASPHPNSSSPCRMETVRVFRGAAPS